MLSLPAVASSTSMCSAPIRVIHSIPAGEALIENVLPHYPIGTPLTGEVVPYGHFTDEWFDANLALLTQLDIAVLND